jgi:hypothetical protein
MPVRVTASEGRRSWIFGLRLLGVVTDLVALADEAYKPLAKRALGNACYRSDVLVCHALFGEVDDHFLLSFAVRLQRMIPRSLSATNLA